MKKNLARWLPGLCLAALLLAFLGVTAAAADAEVDGMQFDLAPDGQSMFLVGYTGNAVNMVVPETVQGLPVTELRWTPFVSTNPSAVAITSITIPKTVKKLPVDNFYYHAANLQSVTVAPENETYSSLDGVLYNKDMTTLLYYPHRRVEKEYRMPDSVTSTSLFSNAETMEHLIVGKGIREGGFSYFPKNLRKITLQESGFLPGGMQNYGSSLSGLLAGLTRLEEIVVHPDNPNYSLHEGVLYNKAQTAVIRCLPSKKGVYTPPATVRSINRGSFSRCAQLTEVVLPKGLIEIQDYAFEGAGITRMTIPDSVTTIPLRGSNSIFKNCKKLETLHIGSGCPNWNAAAGGVSASSNERNMLEGCTALREITVAQGNAALCAVDNALYTKDKKTLIRYPSAAPQNSCVLPEEFDRFGTLAFESCVNLKDVYFPHRDFRFDHNPIVDCSFTMHGYWHTNIRGYAERFGYGFASIDPVPLITKVTISPEKASVRAGENVSFTATVEGENLLNQKIDFLLMGRAKADGQWDSSVTVIDETHCRVNTQVWMLPGVLTVIANVYSPRNDETVYAVAQIAVENRSVYAYWRMPEARVYRQNTGNNWQQFMAYDNDGITWGSSNPDLLPIDERTGEVSVNTRAWPKTGIVYVTAYSSSTIVAAFKVTVTWSLWLWPVAIFLFGWLYL